MIDDYSRDLLRSGIINLKAGDRDSARRYLDRALYMASDHDVLAEAWYQMSRVATDRTEKRRALENCLAHDLRNARARRDLAILDGKLEPGELVDPNALPPAPAALRAADAQRFMCPKCGGRMTFAPDGQSLVCEYCTRHTSLRAGASEPGNLPSARENDFLIAMATARGHARPLAEQVFHCQGCGAQFILSPGQLSITCPYCGSPHVVSFDRFPDLLAPDGIIPHAFDQAHAIELLTAWLQKNTARPRSVGTSLRRSSADPSGAMIDRVRISTGKLPAPTVPSPPPPRGLYLPLWTFELGGEIDYTGEVVKDQDAGFGPHAPRVVHVSDSYPVMLTALPIPASRKLSAPFVRLLPTFDLKAVQPYDPRCLVDWPAELYDIPLDEASLDARSQGLASVKRDMEIRLAPVHLVSASSARLDIQSFRLDLVPVWMTEVQTGAASPLVLINGQTGQVSADLAPKHDQGRGSLLAWLGELVKE